MRRLWGVLYILFALWALPAQAQSIIDQITSQLRAQGYSRVEVSETILGRTRIEAKSRDWEREVIVNPRTGEILRDYWEPRSGSANRASSGGLIQQSGSSKSQNRNRNRSGEGSSSDRSGSSSGKSGSSGNSGSGSDDKDDDGDKGDDSDNSGHGSGGDGGDDSGGDDGGGDD